MLIWLISLALSGAGAGSGSELPPGLLRVASAPRPLPALRAARAAALESPPVAFSGEASSAFAAADLESPALEPAVFDSAVFASAVFVSAVFGSGVRTLDAFDSAPFGVVTVPREPAPSVALEAAAAAAPVGALSAFATVASRAPEVPVSS